MKALLAICMFLATTLVLAENNPTSIPAGADSVSGEVLEIKDVDSYTYLRLKTKDGETWAAVSKAAIKTGAKVTIDNAMVIDNFESKTLKKTFPTIIFGSLRGATGSSAVGGNDTANPHSNLAESTDAGEIHVPKASGTNAYTVAEIVKKAAELKEKPVLLRGKIVKYNANIMGVNWIHLRDGSGSAADNTNDLLVTTKSPAKTGDVVLVKGIVRTDKDFGAGYTYKVLIENATVQE
jgi:hypothetical protein